MADHSGQTIWDYDTAGQLSQETKTIIGAPDTLVTKYTYDDFGRLQGMTYPDGEAITYTLNQASQVEHVIGSTPYMTATYNSVGRLDTQWLGGVITQNFSYHPSLRPQSASANGGSLQNLSFTFDDLGRLNTYNDWLQTFDLDYNYDSFNRLFEVQSVTLPQQVYTYTAIGNLAVKNGLTPVTLDYTAPGSLPHAPGQAVISGTTPLTLTLTYDKNGNRASRQTSGGSVAYLYDTENRLTGVDLTQVPFRDVIYSYDGQGERVQRSALGDKEHYYLNDSYEIIAPYIRLGTLIEPTPTWVRPTAAAASGLYAAWGDNTSYGTLYLARRSAGGTWLQPATINTAGFHAAEPALAAVVTDSQDILNVAWGGQDTTGGAHLYLSRSTDGGTTWIRSGNLSHDTSNAYYSRQPVLAADGTMMHLAWSEQSPNYNIYYRTWQDGYSSWGTAEQVTHSQPSNAQDCQPDLAVTAAGNVAVVWVRHGWQWDKPGDVYLHLRVGGSWQLDETRLSAGQGEAHWPRIAATGNDLHVIWYDRQAGALRYWQSQSGESIILPGSEGAAASNEGGALHDLAVDGTGRLVATWVAANGDTVQASRNTDGSWSARQVVARGSGGANIALAVNQAGDLQVIQRRGQTLYHLTGDGEQIIKRYTAGPGGHPLATRLEVISYTLDITTGEEVATRTENELYYQLFDPTGLSLTFTKAQTVAGRVLYDAFGGVLTRTLPLTGSGGLTTTLSPAMIDLLAGQGTTDPDTGLVYLGNGRYFDPLLGLPLQPNPLGGAPTVPQSLNRYAATSLGPPGVAEGVDVSPTNATFVALRDTILQTALGYGTGEVIRATTWGGLTIITSKSTWYRTIGQANLGLRPLFRRPSIAQPQFGQTFRAYTTLDQVRELGNGRYLVETGQVIDTARLPNSARVRVTSLIRNFAGASTAFGISATFQTVEDWNDPFLIPTQKYWRIGISGVGGVGAWGVGLIATEVAAGAGAGSWAGPIGIGVGAVATFIWAMWIQPVIFEVGGLNPERDLAPLQN